MEEISYKEADSVLTQTIKTLAGAQADPKADQFAAVRTIVSDRNRTLVVQATGWGKSGVYWAATKILRNHNYGPTLVISPLLALMRDQVQAAEKAGLTSVTINSSNPQDHQDSINKICNNTVDVVLISPERLASPNFENILTILEKNAGLLVIDEAHCLSDWGTDFRPDYQRLSKLLLKNSDRLVLATTATANKRVSDDVAKLLGPDTVTLRGDLSRKSLTLSVINSLSTVQRYAWVAQALDKLPGSGIIYCLTVADTEKLTTFLRSQGHKVDAYNSSVDTQTRHFIETQLKDNKIKAVVATSALGMGYDKADIGFVVHVGTPSSPVAYYQQIGRAGRGIDHAEIILLPSVDDKRITEYFVTSTIPNQDHMRVLLAKMSQTVPVTSAFLEKETSFRRSEVEHLLKIAAVDDAVKKTLTGWVLTNKNWVYDQKKYDGLVAARRKEITIMDDYVNSVTCLSSLLRAALDDNVVENCEQCSVCTGRLPFPGRTVDVSFVDAATSFFKNVSIDLPVRSLWPSGCAQVKGKIRNNLIPGHALAYGDDPVWSSLLTETFLTESVPEELLQGLVGVVARWSKTWKVRPTGIVFVSTNNSDVAKEAAVKLSSVSGIPLFNVFSCSSYRFSENVNSRTYVDELFTNLIMDSGVVERLPSGPVLLVADVTKTSWTFNVAAQLLTSAGVVNDVYPLALHKLP